MTSPALDDDRHPWLRQRRESAAEHELFVAYREAGSSRSLERVATDRNVSLGAVRRMAVKRRWEDRALAYDRHIDEAAVEAERRAHASMRKNHLAIAQALQHLGLREVQKRIKRSEATKEDEPTVPLKEALDAVDRGVRLERLNRELPEHTHGVVGSLDTGGSARAWVMQRIDRMAQLLKATDKPADGDEPTGDADDLSGSDDSHGD